MFSVCTPTSMRSTGAWHWFSLGREECRVLGFAGEGGLPGTVGVSGMVGFPETFGLPGKAVCRVSELPGFWVTRFPGTVGVSGTVGLPGTVGLLGKSSCRVAGHERNIGTSWTSTETRNTDPGPCQGNNRKDSLFSFNKVPSFSSPLLSSPLLSSFSS